MNTISSKTNLILCGALCLFLAWSTHAWSTPKTKQRTIKKVETIQVETPVGTAPRLPWQVWVTYSDGTHEWRQTRWMNSQLSTERQEANPELNPAGKTYTVEGFIIGDNTTENGYPITAKVSVTSQPWNVPSNTPAAQPLPLSDVVIKGDNRLTNNRDLAIKTILSWDVEQQLYNYRDTYGLPTEGYPKADGWDSPTTKLKGHGSGHYMSALAFAYASATKTEHKMQLRTRIQHMVDELRKCQERTFVWDSTLNRYWEARDYAPEEELKQMKGNWAAFDEYKKDYQHYGYGYLNAIPAAHPALIECYRAYNNEEWVWAPYYSIHKQLAGLIDIANVMSYAPTIRPRSEVSPHARTPLYTTNKEIADKALLIAKDMGLWVWNRMHYRTYVKTDGTVAERHAKPGNRYEMWNTYIAGEVGGMAESLSRLAEMVNDSTEKAHLIEAANCFDSPAFFDPVAKNVDDIRTRHANQHIPMITGALRSYIINNTPYYYNLAYNFWNLVQGRYTYAMGGVGNGEMFRQPYSQMLSMNTNVQSDFRRNMYPNPTINETCCAYNLAKLSKDLNCFDPDNAAYMDYYERVLYNQIVGSVHPEHWGVTYHYAVGMNARKPYGNLTPQSTCCGGTGAENHVKYQEAAYFAKGNTLWVTLYLPSEAQWRANTIKQDCEWPAEKSTITFKPAINKKLHTFSIKLRVPYWATSGFDVKLNGHSIAKKYKPSSYVEIAEREWSADDKIEVLMPFSPHINWGPDKMDIAATGKNETQTPFTPQWVGALMYGPLVMATPDIKEWKDAEFSLHSDLSDIQPNGASSETGFNGHLYTLTFNGKQFQPDYYQTENSTHYLRLNMETGKKSRSKKGVDMSSLKHALQIAKERVDRQTAWNALSVKTPAFSPWAPYGYARLVQQVNQAEEIIHKSVRAITQDEVNTATSTLNMAINTMRPGNLAEPEDLGELLQILTKAKNNPDITTDLREAINYADMVVQYVNDGSGTRDLIDKALKRLVETMNTVEIKRSK